MDARQAGQAARSWVEAEIAAGRWPGLRAAHLVGGITSMPPTEPFPAAKDVDLHLIFAEGSPALAGEGPLSGILEASFGGIAIEAGLKSVADYRSPEVVLANPEIAHHLTGDVVLYDPDGLLRDLQPPVRRGYPRRRWVRARLDHEQRGQAGALEMLRLARASWGASAEVNLLGYSTTFATAALQVAALDPPRMGSRSLLRLGESLAAHDRGDLYEEILAVLGVATADRATAERLLAEAIEAFDLATTIQRPTEAFGPFQHKLHRHLRPYFVDSCRSLLAEGFHREALGWVLPYHLATADVILTDGPAAARPVFAARQTALLRVLGLDTAEARASAAARATRTYDRIFVLAEEIIAAHPGVVD